jgi:hypothetical protein
MKIPKQSEARKNFYYELIEKCMVSANDRKPRYSVLRNNFLFGSSEGYPCTFNKIYPHIDLLTSFLFSIDTTRFSVELDADASALEIKKLSKVTKAVNEVWHKGNADVVFNTCLQWALVYNTMVCKVIPVKGGGVSYHAVEPGSFGVLREDIPYIDRQEAMAQMYYITKSELERLLDEHPNKAIILSQLEGTQQRPDDSVPDAVQRLVISASTPTMQGNASIAESQQQYRPQVAEDLVKMYELWVWNSDINDYQTVTMAEQGALIYDRKNIFVEGEVPFVQVCPNPLYDYFWGESEVERLIELQKFRTDRLNDIDDLFSKQVKPPTSLNGSFGIPDEMNFALNYAGGLLKSQDPTAKVERFVPQFPPEAFQIINEIDQMFSEASGMNNISMGRGEPGVRSKSHADTLARIGSSRAKKRALIIEDALEKVAGLTLKVLRHYDKTRYLDEDGMPFSMGQFTNKCVVKVDAHSSSPIYVEDYKQLVFELAKAKAIDRKSMLELLHPPMESILLERLKGIEKAEADAQQQQAQQQQAPQKAK